MGPGTTLTLDSEKLRRVGVEKGLRTELQRRENRKRCTKYGPLYVCPKTRRNAAA